jgi:hypothetical protein
MAKYFKYFCFLILFQVASVWSADIDCKKLHGSLCDSVKASTADTDTFSISISFFHPEPNHSCDPRANPDCPNGYDSGYYAKLKTDTQKLFTTYQLWDSRNPTLRLSTPTETLTAYTAILVTKATLIKISNESFVNILEAWVNYGPATIHSNKGNQLQVKRIPNSYLSNGQNIRSLSDRKNSIRIELKR